MGGCQVTECVATFGVTWCFTFVRGVSASADVDQLGSDVCASTDVKPVDDTSVQLTKGSPEISIDGGELDELASVGDERSSVGCQIVPCVCFQVVDVDRSRVVPLKDVHREPVQLAFVDDVGGCNCVGHEELGRATAQRQRCYPLESPSFGVTQQVLRHIPGLSFGAGWVETKVAAAFIGILPTGCPLELFAVLHDERCGVDGARELTRLDLSDVLQLGVAVIATYGDNATCCVDRPVLEVDRLDHRDDYDRLFAIAVAPDVRRVPPQVRVGLCQQVGQAVTTFTAKGPVQLEVTLEQTLLWCSRASPFSNATDRLLLAAAVEDAAPSGGFRVTTATVEVCHHVLVQADALGISGGASQRDPGAVERADARFPACVRQFTLHDAAWHVG